MQNNLINTVSNTINQNVNITFPGQSEIQEANDELDDTIENPTPIGELETEIASFVAKEDDNLNYALSKLRTEIEK